MKFYQTVIFVMFFVVYTTITFGSEQVGTIVVPLDILNLIDEFRNTDTNSYKETDFVEKKLYSKENTNDSIGEADCIDTVSLSDDCIAFTYKPYGNYSALEPDFLSLSSMKKKQWNQEDFRKYFSHKQRCKYENFEGILGEAMRKLSKTIKIEEMIGQLTLKHEDNGNIGKLILNFENNEKPEFFSSTKETNCTCFWTAKEGITSINTSEDKKTIVTCCKGVIRKWECQEGLQNEYKLATILSPSQAKDLSPSQAKDLSPSQAKDLSQSQAKDFTACKDTPSASYIFKVAKMIAIAGIAIIFLKLYFNQESIC